MKIHSFKLIEHGRTGVEVGAEEVVGTREGFGILDSVNRKRKLSLNLATMNEIEKLKYFFMVISGYWMEPFNKYFDFESYQPKPVNPDSEMPFGQMALRTLWNRIRIIGAQEKAVGFLLKGTYQISENKVMAINTPVITEDDDYSVFNDALDMLEKIFEMIAGYFAHAENSLEEKKKSMISDHSGEEIDESEITRQVLRIVIRIMLIRILILLVTILLNPRKTGLLKAGKMISLKVLLKKNKKRTRMIR